MSIILEARLNLSSDKSSFSHVPSNAARPVIAASNIGYCDFVSFQLSDSINLTHEVGGDVADQLSVFTAGGSRLWRCLLNERQPEFAVIDTQFWIEVKIQSVIQEHNLEIVRRP